MEITVKAICEDGTIWFSPESKIINDFEVSNERNTHALASMIEEMGLEEYKLTVGRDKTRIDTLITKDDLLVWVNDDMIIIESESEDYEKGEIIAEFELDDYNGYEV